jgi:preprotein translocase subunit SecG
MFTTFVLVIHVVVCLAMILIILLQTGKGADIGAAFGGGSSQTVFGSSGATTFLSKVTIIAAVVFMSTSFILTYFSGRGVSQVEQSIMADSPVTAAPTPGPAPADSAKEGPDKAPAGAVETPASGKAAVPKADVPSTPSGGQAEPASGPSSGSEPNKSGE